MEKEMKIFGSRKSKKQRKKNIFDENPDTRDQFNVIIDEKIKTEVQKMAKILRVNQSAMSEHLFEVGLHHVNGTVKDPDKRKLLEKHLEISHLLSEYDQDEDVVIRITENNRNWILLDYAKQLLTRINRITQTMLNAGKMKDMALFERAEKDLNREMAKFANWVLKFRGDDEEEYDDQPGYRR